MGERKGSRSYEFRDNRSSMAVRKGKITAVSAGAAGKGGSCSEALQMEQIPMWCSSGELELGVAGGCMSAGHPT